MNTWNINKLPMYCKYSDLLEHSRWAFFSCITYEKKIEADSFLLSLNKKLIIYITNVLLAVLLMSALLTIRLMFKRFAWPCRKRARDRKKNRLISMANYRFRNCCVKKNYRARKWIIWAYTYFSFEELHHLLPFLTTTTFL